MQLEMSVDEHKVLLAVVEQALREMRVEVRRTSTPKYHDELQADEKRLEGLLTRLRGLEPSS